MLEDCTSDFGARKYWNRQEWTRRLSQLSPQAAAGRGQGGDRAPGCSEREILEALAVWRVFGDDRGGSCWRTARFRLMFMSGRRSLS